MIESAKLKNLIKEKETIYIVQGNCLFSYRLNEDVYNDGYYYDFDNDCLYLMKQLNNEEDECEYAWFLEELFATKSEAEQALKRLA